MSYMSERHELKGGFGATSAGPSQPWKEYESPAPRASKWNPRTWSRRTILLALGAAVILLVVLIVAIYFGVHNSSSYPDYAPLAYTLQDTYAGQDFFDNFNYFTGYDPTFGFVRDWPPLNDTVSVDQFTDTCTGSLRPA